MTILTVTLTQMAQLSIFMAIGYLLSITKKIPKTAPDGLSVLLLYLFLPATCFSIFSTQCTRSVLSQKAPILIAGFATLFALFAVGFLLARVLAKSPPTRAVIAFSLIVSNVGFLGYPLTEGVFGREILFDFMVFTMPFNLFIYSFGAVMLNPKLTLSLKSLISPTVVAMLLGMVVGLFQIPLPAVVDGCIDMACDALAPCAMILIGLVLAELSLKAAFTDWRAYLITLFRLVLLPLAFLGIALVTKIPNHLALLIITTLCLPVGQSAVVFPRAFGGDSENGAKYVLLSCLAGIFTIPLIYAMAVCFFPI